MPRRRVNHINPTLEAPGFHGSPNESRALKALAFKDGENVRPSPYGDIPLQISQPEYALGGKLTTGRRFNKGYEAELPKTKEFNYPRKNAKPGVFPQSGLGGDKNFRASSSETYFDPNENPIPVMLDILDAQRTSFAQDERSAEAVKRREEIPDFDKTPDFIYLQSREEEGINQYFADISESFNQERINKLIAKGFSEDEIARYIDKEREKAIEKALKNPDDPEVLMRVALAKHMKDRKVAFVHPTATNASGIGSRSDTQSIHTVGMAVKSPLTRRKEAREAMVGAELARAVAGGFDNNYGRRDPRDTASALLGANNRGRAPAVQNYLMIKDREPDQPVLRFVKPPTLEERIKREGPVKIEGPPGTKIVKTKTGKLALRPAEYLTKGKRMTLAEQIDETEYRPRSKKKVLVLPKED